MGRRQCGYASLGYRKIMMINKMSEMVALALGAVILLATVFADVPIV